jgi:hypothetical protein
VGFASFSAIAGAEGFTDTISGARYGTRRTAAGWVTAAEELPASGYGVFVYGGLIAQMGASLGGQAGAYAARGVGQPENRVDLYLHHAGGAVVDVGPALPPSAPSGTLHELGDVADLFAIGVSADGSRVLFDSSRYFWPGDGTEEVGTAGKEGKFHSLYEYLGAGNTTPLLVGVDSSGRQISECGTVLGAGSPTGSAGNGLIDSSHNAISADGNTVFFTAYPDNYTLPNPPFSNDGCRAPVAPPVAEVFARVDNGLPGAHTVAISEPSKEDCAACDTEAGVLAEAHFEGASADGSKVFFSTTQPLLGDDTSRNLYEYDFGAPAGQRVVRVSAGDATVADPAAGVLPTKCGLNQGAVCPLVSEDGSHVYFVAHGVLSMTPNARGEAAQPGADTLYVFERDAAHPAGRIAFIAVLSNEDVEQLGPLGSSGPDVTPDGRFLVFESHRDLTPDDTTTARQLFEYDAQTGALVRVSVGQHGFNHNGNVPGEPGIPSPSYSFKYESSAYWGSMPVSADGSYVFFESPAGLTPQALNEVPGVKNIYEYHDGEVSLISDGQDASNGGVQLYGTDESGRDVFFTTIDPLVGQDSGADLDVYDARVGGGFPPPVSPPSCSEEVCQGALSGAPTLLSPGSEFQAGGNPPLAAAAVSSTGPRPKVKSRGKGKCVRGVRRARGRCSGRSARRSSRGGRGR